MGVRSLFQRLAVGRRGARAVDLGDPHHFAGATTHVGAAKRGAPAVAVGAVYFDEQALEGDDVVAFDGEELAADLRRGR